MLDHVIEHIDKLTLPLDDKLDLFRILAEMCPFCTEFDRSQERLGKLFSVLMVKETLREQRVRRTFVFCLVDIFTRAAGRTRNRDEQRGHTGFSIFIHRMFNVRAASVVSQISGFSHRPRE